MVRTFCNYRYIIISRLLCQVAGVHITLQQYGRSDFISVRSDYSLPVISYSLNSSRLLRLLEIKHILKKNGENFKEGMDKVETETAEELYHHEHAAHGHDVSIEHAAHN